MKFTLTINDATASELQTLLAALGASTAIVTTINAPSGDFSAPLQASGSLQATGSMPAPGPMPTHDEGDGAPNVAAPAFDTTGLPWDERIHAGTKAQSADGTWRKRRGVADSVVSAIEQELRAKMNNQPAPTMPMNVPIHTPAPSYTPPEIQAMIHANQPQPQPVMQMPAQTMPIPMQPQAAIPMPTGAPIQSAFDAPVQQQAAPPPASSLDFHGFMQGLSSAMAKGVGVDQAYIVGLVQRINQAFGSQLNAITDISSSNDPRMPLYAAQLMQADGKW